MSNERCHPGGFSLAMFQRNSEATGEGVALPESQGGIRCFLEEPMRSRIHIHTHDVTRFNLMPKDSEMHVPADYPPPPFSTKFDLILLDAHRFDTGDETIVSWEPVRMIFSQLSIAFEYLTVGGIVVIRLGNPTHDQTAAIMYILSRLFESIKVHKPISSHDHRKSFYTVASGFQKDTFENSNFLQSVLETFRDCWWKTTFGGQDGKGVNVGEWWEEIVRTEDLPELFGERLIQLSLPLWEIQTEGLKKYFGSNGIKF
jgi:23S rRNA U2552 (ribose-2'-O)-methylase RlmE/FtsJ